MHVKVNSKEQLTETHARVRAAMGWPIFGKLSGGGALLTVCLKTDEKVWRMSGLKKRFPLVVYKDDMNDAYVDEKMTYRTIIKFHIWSKEELVAFEKVLSKLNSHICGWFWSIVVERAMCIKEGCIQVGDGNFACLIANVVELLVQLWRGEWLRQLKEKKRMLN